MRHPEVNNYRNYLVKTRENPEHFQEDNSAQLIDDFLVIGASPSFNESQLIEIDNDRFEDSNDPKEKLLAKMKAYEPIEAGNIYSQTHDIDEIERCVRRRVLKTFCHPNDVPIFQVETMQQVEQLVVQ